jgi:FKBP-type peptidyl-prolyl cis-trans isomerase FklB
MLKSLTAFVFPTLVSGIVLLGLAQAQTPAASSTQTSQPAGSSSQASGSTAKTTTAKKPATAAAPLTLKTQKEKQSYAVGMSMGQGLQRQQVPVDPALVARGLRDAMAGKAILKDDEMKAALQELRSGLQKNMEAKAQQEGNANKIEGDAFLAANKSKDGVKTLPDGLQYKILQEGSGPKPTASDTVSVNYRGTLINGKEFDSSYKRGQPATFPVGGVIKGWTEALQLMPVGSKWQLFIPSDLAYGDRGAGADIGPNATLIFEVELLSIGEQKK